ncbi:MAG: hypothetical protein LKE41_08085 [Prevotella sp.]|jgi:hypothetical protein|nr:hypothetical protein [Prevotella sp.]MCI2079461.1 hypothetical protein [Prevotella sp.]MCI2101279.1 hypothetical protein [Prevotella sp.]
MKKIFHFAFLAMVVATGLMSCTDDYSYDPAVKDATSSQAFLNTADGASSYTYTPDMEQKLTIKVGRPDSTQAATIALSADNSKFKVPSTISFAAGEGTKSVDVTFDMETGTSEGVCIAVAPENAYQYGVDSLKLSITRDYTWVKFKDKGLFTNTVLGPENAPIVIAQAKEKPGLYKLYKPLTSIIKEQELDPSVDTDYEVYVNPTDAKKSSFGPYWAGFANDTYGNVYHVARSIAQEDNVITIHCLLCVVYNGRFADLYGLDDAWVITLPDE